ncbi:NADP oxidoreductase [Mycolicibacter terrae]|uniref:NADP oxidoreductase n=1 Tax=Mycolicibacter terrae TaxID=1788 RepID=A0AAD1HXJ5_9MYCO|nr:NAD(P)-binding domain-containing protein [Mycolicibacter terrae]ORW97502.1 NADP oxidoreductase [Mycolicibacter terrae]BBX22654.1 NADP oxidoreductase [Mycolicibacter terrae]SNV73184.1 reductase [Mycolicibacter terrae]
MNSISIIGLGSMASALAHRAVAGGNAVEVIGRDQTKAKELAAAVGGAAVGTPGIAPVGEIVILAVPYASAAVVVSEYGDALRGKVIIDITNPMTSDFTGLVTPEGSSAAEEIAKVAPAGTHVVKAFNTLFANVLADSPADVFIAGDDAAAKGRVSAFIESLGLRSLDTGQLPMARALENAALLQMGLLAHSVKHTNFFLGVSLLS